MNPHNPHHNVLRTSICIWEWSIRYSSLSAMFTPLHSSTNQELFEKYVCNQSSSMNQELFEKYLYNQSSHYKK